MTYQEIIKTLKSKANPKNVAGMARFGIQGGTMLGISVVELRKLGKQIGKDHQLALKLWESGIHEARILASIIDDPKLITEGQMEDWVKDFDSWDVCDQVCGNVFDKTPFALDKIREWSKRSREFEKRAAFALLAYLAVHDKKLTDEVFIKLLPIIAREAHDDRNYVRKAVNWALRQIGKRNSTLRTHAMETAEEIAGQGSKSARWIAADALRELTTIQK